MAPPPHACWLAEHRSPALLKKRRALVDRLHYGHGRVMHAFRMSRRTASLLAPHNEDQKGAASELVLCSLAFRSQGVRSKRQSFRSMALTGSLACGSVDTG